MAGQTKERQVQRSAGLLAPIGSFGIGWILSRAAAPSRRAFFHAAPTSTTQRTTTIKETE